MATQGEFEYEVFNGVMMRPGVEVYCDDRDTPLYDALGKIISVQKKGEHIYSYEVNFGTGVWTMDSMQIWPCDTNTEEAIIWRMERNLKIFLCHGSEDKESVRALYKLLKAAEMRPWLDEIDIKIGQEWDMEIRKAIKECHVILVVLSSSSVGKEGYIQKEIRFALDRADEMPENRIFIIPVRLDKCELPQRLQKWQWLDFFEPGSSKKLLEGLKEHSKNIAIK